MERGRSRPFAETRDGVPELRDPELRSLFLPLFSPKEDVSDSNRIRNSTIRCRQRADFVEMAANRRGPQSVGVHNVRGKFKRRRRGGLSDAKGFKSLCSILSAGLPLNDASNVEAATRDGDF